MSIVSSIVSCANLQDRLNQHFMGLNGKVTEPNGLLQFLVSPANTNNVLQRQIGTGGRIRTVELIYKQRLTTDAVSSTSTQNCDGGNERGTLSTTYTIDPDAGSSIPWSFTTDTLITACEANDNWLAEELASRIDVLKRHISEQIASTLVANFGDFYDSTNAAKTVSTKLSNGEISYELNEIVKYEFEQMGYYDTVFAVGDNELIKHARRLDASCCITTLGIDPGVYASRQPVMFIQDREVKEAFASNAAGNKFAAIAAGAVQFLRWNEFVGERGIIVLDDDTYKQGTIVDPSTGLEFDYLAKFDCGKWNFQLKLAHDLAFLPTDMFEAVDAYHGVNWVNQFTISNS